ncbi:MAG: SAM hydrolase/SAM-dependent halogenase family protein [Chloroflexota bacterium]
MVLTLTTDFGLKDGFVGVMKGVIYGIAPEVKIVDISHLIAPQNVREGAYTLWRHAPFFPPGSIHVAVVDPGVGTSRRPVGARLGNQLYIAPDNGLLTPLILDAETAGAEVEFVHLDRPKYWLKTVSRTFHGRDIFSPCGAHLAAGVPLTELGSPISNLTRLDWSQPEPVPGGWRAHVTIIDVFGNLTTDLPAAKLAGLGPLVVRVKGREIDGLVDSYGHRRPGDLVALVDSEEFVEVAVVNGSAARELDVEIGEIVEVAAKRV